MSECYKIPVDFGAIIRKRMLPKCSFEDSIKQNILLILLTHFDEYHFDPTYGCSIWDQDFELLPSANDWRKRLQESIYTSLNSHERRLTQLKIAITIDELPFTHPEDHKVRRIKKRIIVVINAKLKITNQDFLHKETVFFSPISLD